SRNLPAHVEAVTAGRVIEPAADSPVPVSLWRIIARGLDPDPLARHGDMGNLLAALEGVVHEPAAPEQASIGTPLSWFIAVLAVLLAVVGLVGLELGWFAGAEDPRPLPSVPGETQTDL